jgi:hypothetical protein
MANSGPPRDAAFSAAAMKGITLERLTAVDVAAGRINVVQLYVNGVSLEDYICGIASSGECNPPDLYSHSRQVLPSQPANALSGVPSLIQQSVSQDHSPRTSEIPALRSGTATPFLDGSARYLQRRLNETMDEHERQDRQVSASISATAPLRPNSQSGDDSDGHDSKHKSVPFAEVATRAARAHVADIAHGFHDPVNGRKGYVLTSDEYGQGAWKALPPVEHHGGDVEGPLQSKMDSVAVFDSTQGRLLRDSSVFVRDHILIAPIVEAQEVHIVGDPHAAEGSLAVKGPDGKIVWQPPESPRTANTSATTPPPPVPVFRGLREDAAGHITIGDLHLNTVYAPHGIAAQSVPIVDTTGEVNWKPLVETLEQSSLEIRDLTARQGVVEKLITKDIVTDDIAAQSAAIVDLALPQGAIKGHVLTCADATGKSCWQPPPAPPPPNVVMKAETLADADGDKRPLAHFAQTNDNCISSAEHACISMNGHCLEVPMITSQNITADCVKSAVFESPSSSWHISDDKVVLSGKSICIGSGALKSLHGACTGEDIVAIGVNSQQKLVDGTGNVSIGRQALQSNQSGHFNTALGDSSLQFNTGGGNTAVGAGSLAALISGGHNTSLGAGSSDLLIHGANNTSLGDGAGPVGDLCNTISIGRGAKAQSNGDVALGSSEAPVRISRSAAAGDLTGLNPVAYLSVTLNGVPYKLALYHP